MRVASAQQRVRCWQSPFLLARGDYGLARLARKEKQAPFENLSFVRNEKNSGEVFEVPNSNFKRTTMRFLLGVLALSSIIVAASAAGASCFDFLFQEIPSLIGVVFLTLALVFQSDLP